MSVPELTGFLPLDNKKDGGACSTREEVESSPVSYWLAVCRLTGCTTTHTDSPAQVINSIQLISSVLLLLIISVYLFFNYLITFHEGQNNPLSLKSKVQEPPPGDFAVNLGRCELSAAAADHSSLESLQAVLFPYRTLTLLRAAQRRRSDISYQRCSDKESGYSWGADGEGGSGGGGTSPCSQAGEKHWIEVKYSQSCVWLLCVYLLA